MIEYTPVDSAGCITGCPACVPSPEEFTCGVAVERCTEDNPDCIQVYPCDNSDQVLLAKPCSEVDCVFTESMEKVQPCVRDCVNITQTVIEPPHSGECEKFISAMFINDRTTGKLTLTTTGQDCRIEDEMMYYGEYDPHPYITSNDLEWIPEWTVCVDEFYMAGDLVCYCQCDDDHETTSGVNNRLPPPPREDVKPPNPPPRRASPPPPREDVKSPSPPPPREDVKPPSPPPPREDVKSPSPPEKPDDDGITEDCREFVDEYGDKIITAIQTVPATRVCSFINLCSPPTGGVPDSPMCSLCNFAVNYVQDALAANQTVAEIIEYVKKECDILDQGALPSPPREDPEPLSPPEKPDDDGRLSPPPPRDQWKRPPPPREISKPPSPPPRDQWKRPPPPPRGVVIVDTFPVIPIKDCGGEASHSCDREVLSQARRRLVKRSDDAEKNKEIASNVDKLTEVFEELAQKVTKIEPGKVIDNFIHTETLGINLKYMKRSNMTIPDQVTGCLARPLVTRCIVSEVVMTRKLLQSLVLYDYDVYLNSTNATELAITVNEEVKNVSSVYDMNIIAVSDQALLLGADDTDIEMFERLGGMDYNVTNDNTFTYDTSLSGDIYYSQDLPVLAPGMGGFEPSSHIMYLQGIVWFFILSIVS
jgi:hypothetical protein